MPAEEDNLSIKTCSTPPAKVSSAACLGSSADMFRFIGIFGQVGDGVIMTNHCYVQWCLEVVTTLRRRLAITCLIHLILFLRFA